MGWQVEHLQGDAAAFHARPLPDTVERTVWVCEAARPALVLGSAQPLEVADERACVGAGVEIVRRHSGGGAVLVEPSGLLWVDVLVPADDPLWAADVGQSFAWLGETWAGALADLGVTTVVHRGALQHGPWSQLVCFAGLGPGELTDPAGRKVLGLSQRRTRAGARFQCAALGWWEPDRLLDLLSLDAAARDTGRLELATVAAGVGIDLGDLLDAFLHRLP